MKKSTITAILALSVPFSMPALAGPNWDVIHRAEANKAAHKHEPALVLPLDYGPRAITTPWLNRERLAHLIAQTDKQKKVIASRADKNGTVLAAHAHRSQGSHS